VFCLRDCFDAALALVAARKLYLIILRFFGFFWMSFGGCTPTSDNFQKSKEKNWENLDFFQTDAVGNREIHVRGTSLAVIWISVRTGRPRKNPSLLCTIKV